MRRLAIIKRYLSGCFGSYGKFLEAVDKRNDSILNFVGAARFADLAIESKTSELLHLRATMIGAAGGAEEMHVAYEMTVSIERLYESIGFYVNTASDTYCERLASMIRANDQVSATLTEYLNKYLALKKVLSKPISRIAVSIRPQPIPPPPAIERL